MQDSSYFPNVCLCLHPLFITCRSVSCVAAINKSTKMKYYCKTQCCEIAAPFNICNMRSGKMPFDHKTKAPKHNHNKSGCLLCIRQLWGSQSQDEVSVFVDCPITLVWISLTHLWHITWLFLMLSKWCRSLRMS